MKEENHSNPQTDGISTEKENKFPDFKLQEDITLEEKSTEESKDQLQELKNQLEKEEEKYLRLLADFKNREERIKKEKIDLIHNASEKLISEILPILGDFERAIKQSDASSTEEEGNNKKGIILIYEKLMKVLKKEGLEEICPEKGEVFDTDLQEAISQMPAPSEDFKGKIIEIYSKGYKLGNNVIQYAKVVIGS